MKKNLTILSTLTLFSAFVFAESNASDFNPRLNAINRIVKPTLKMRIKALQDAVDKAATDNTAGLFGATSNDYVVCYRKEDNNYKSTVHPAKERVGQLVTEQAYDTDENKNQKLRDEVSSVLGNVYNTGDKQVINYEIGGVKKSALVVYLDDGSTDRCLLVNAG